MTVTPTSKQTGKLMETSLMIHEKLFGDIFFSIVSFLTIARKICFFF